MHLIEILLLYFASSGWLVGQLAANTDVQCEIDLTIGFDQYLLGNSFDKTSIVKMFMLVNLTLQSDESADCNLDKGDKYIDIVTCDPNDCNACTPTSPIKLVLTPKQQQEDCFSFLNSTTFIAVLQPYPLRSSSSCYQLNQLNAESTNQVIPVSPFQWSSFQQLCHFKSINRADWSTCPPTSQPCAHDNITLEQIFSNAGHDTPEIKLSDCVQAASKFSRRLEFSYDAAAILEFDGQNFVIPNVSLDSNVCPTSLGNDHPGYYKMLKYLAQGPCYPPFSFQSGQLYLIFYEPPIDVGNLGSWIRALPVSIGNETSDTWSEVTKLCYFCNDTNTCVDDMTLPGANLNDETAPSTEISCDSSCIASISAAIFIFVAIIVTIVSVHCYERRNSSGGNLTALVGLPDEAGHNSWQQAELSSSYQRSGLPVNIGIDTEETSQ